ncbi:MAG: alpha/beta fold hydrolase [Desulfobacteraceae bacterium]|jgi:alpha/beta superfamily hydrolase|nr:alpha/beta fold hydrolase [Desulfobacteraceae bacterium]
MEKTVTFISNRLEIEGRVTGGDHPKGVAITHPHPLYGGDMRNNVVAAVSRTYQKFGCTTLRFNFRGVGGSQGNYDDGMGEQEDVRAAVAYLADSGIRQIDLAGYSFGAWVNALAVNDGLKVDNMIMVSPPVAFIDFKSISNLSSLKLIVTGSRDDIAPADRVEKLYPTWNPAAKFEVIEGADHFYGGHADQLEAVLTHFLAGPDLVK